MASSFFALFDDVAALTKIAAKKTSGVIGDDLALNAQQLQGTLPEQELPVIYAVAKGAFLNKVILVPLAMLISAFVPWLIMPLLMIGGVYLCFEGVEKILEKIFPHAHEVKTETIEEKIKGAIRTDFILSAEIVVIALGSVASASILNQAIALSFIAILMTFGIYGFVALIIKLDDMGLVLLQKNNVALKWLGKGLVQSAPWIMSVLGVVGTAAMFLVGGGILIHGIPWIHHQIEAIVSSVESMKVIVQLIAEASVGILAGLVAVGVLKSVSLLKGKK